MRLGCFVLIVEHGFENNTWRGVVNEKLEVVDFLHDNVNLGN